MSFCAVCNFNFMDKFLQIHGVKTHEEYYELIIESIDNGQFKQAKELFGYLMRANKKNFIKYYLNYLKIEESDTAAIMFFIELI